jgi:predicted Zn-dependent protease
MISLFLLLAMVAPQLGTLEGYLFRETDGGPPRRPLTVELIDQDRPKYHETTAADGSFVFKKVRDGRYTIRARFGDFIIVQEAVTVLSTGRNFTALMLPKRWAKGQTFRAVTADNLAAQSDRELQAKLRNAMKLAGKGDFAGAARLYEQAAAASPQADLWDRLGLIYLQLERKDDAFQAFEQAIKQAPEYLLTFKHLGTVYQEERRYKELLAVAQRALAIDSKWLTGYVFLGEAQAKTGNLEAAQRAAETASELVRGKAPEPYLLLAKIRWARRDCAGARQHMGRYLELNTSARELPETIKSLEMLQACGSVPSNGKE